MSWPPDWTPRPPPPPPEVPAPPAPLPARPQPPGPPRRRPELPELPELPGRPVRATTEAAEPFISVLDRLLERRIVLLTGHLDEPAASRAAAAVMLLDADGDEPIDLHLACPDGELDAAAMLAETLELAGAPVSVSARGTVGGAALAALAAGDRRLASPHARFLLREPSASYAGRADEIAVLAAEHERRLARFRDRLAAVTGQPVERIADDLRAGRALSAADALEYGLVTEVVATTGRR